MLQRIEVLDAPSALLRYATAARDADTFIAVSNALEQSCELTRRTKEPAPRRSIFRRTGTEWSTSAPMRFLCAGQPCSLLLQTPILSLARFFGGSLEPDTADPAQTRDDVYDALSEFNRRADGRAPQKRRKRSGEGGYTPSLQLSANVNSLFSDEGDKIRAFRATVAALDAHAARVYCRDRGWQPGCAEHSAHGHLRIDLGGSEYVQAVDTTVELVRSNDEEKLNRAEIKLNANPALLEQYNKGRTGVYRASAPGDLGRRTPDLAPSSLQELLHIIQETPRRTVCVRALVLVGGIWEQQRITDVRTGLALNVFQLWYWVDPAETPDPPAADAELFTALFDMEYGTASH